MAELIKLNLLQFFIVIIAIVVTTPAVGYNGDDYYFNETDTFNQLILDIYIDETGKALVTGYVDDINGLSFLETAEYLYENDTKQLYALTNALTWKYADKWVLNFSTCDYYTDYHTVFYLPEDVKLLVSHSKGLEHFVTTSNESLVIDVQGYNIESPATTIEYQQPLRETDDEGGDSGFSLSPGYLLLIIALSVLTLALFTVIVKQKRRGDQHAEEQQVRVKEGKIEPTREMVRVMETLTERERAIVNALLKHNGEMTQADLRYETGIPKSSLTGTLRSLERRKIIIKKEWGRTNVIELSEWFLSEGERK
ncbi:MAG: helix-turn-helix domain-containing protein [Methanophagales archaeon]|nr:helix-turn-helix domain-containing protein [Methanophagales archaeon]RLG33843.1 MAG: hypothetical protein DRN97_04030 [Methanosarcinales archaeon]